MPALIVLVPGTLLTISQRAVYAGYVFIPLTALIIFTKIFMTATAKASPHFSKLLDVCSAIIIILAAHFILVGFSAAALKYFIIYLVSSILGVVLGTLGRRLVVSD